MKVYLADPPGSVLHSWVTSGGAKMERSGSSITEGIGQVSAVTQRVARGAWRDVVVVAARTVRRAARSVSSRLPSPAPCVRVRVCVPPPPCRAA